MFDFVSVATDLTVTHLIDLRETVWYGVCLDAVDPIFHCAAILPPIPDRKRPLVHLLIYLRVSDGSTALLQVNPKHDRQFCSFPCMSMIQLT